MLRKITAGATALAVLGSIVLAATPASAQRYHRGGGWHGGGWNGGYHRGGGGAVLGGLAAGALIGSALAARPYYGGYPAYYQQPAYVEAPAYADDDGYCTQRFKSYDPASGTYLGYDGLRHPCP